MNFCLLSEVVKYLGLLCRNKQDNYLNIDSAFMALDLIDIQLLYS